MALFSCAAFAQRISAGELPRVFIYGRGNLHEEVRETYYHGTLDAQNYDVFAGVDVRVLEELNFTMGARFGWYAETLLTLYMVPELSIYQEPSIGLQVRYLIPLPVQRLYLTTGAAVDVLIYFDDLHRAEGETLYMFTGASLGAEYLITRNLFVELVVEAGIFPFFKPSRPSFLKAGIRSDWSSLLV